MSNSVSLSNISYSIQKTLMIYRTSTPDFEPVWISTLVNGPKKDQNRILVILL